MSSVNHFEEELRHALSGEPWHGPALAKLLKGVDAAAAAAYPIPGAHSIWEIVHHLTVWNDVPRRRIDGERLVNMPEEFNWPPVEDASAGAWRAALAALDRAHDALHERVLALADSQLDDPVTGSDPTVRGMLLGVLQHNAYHAGQIVLLGKGLGTRP